MMRPAEEIAREEMEAWMNDWPPEIEVRMARQIRIARQEAIEAAAEVADGFTCGACGMDGKSGIAIRALAQEAAR